MPLSKHHIDTNIVPVAFDLERLGCALESELTDVVFAYVHGSAAHTGVVTPHSDLDIALLMEPSVVGEVDVDSLAEILNVVERVGDDLAPGVRCDVGILNNTEPVFRFEVLKGRLLFCRDQERWLRFYSVTCREYESQLYHYEKQHRYRLEATL